MPQFSGNLRRSNLHPHCELSLLYRQTDKREYEFEIGRCCSLSLNNSGVPVVCAFSGCSRLISTVSLTGMEQQVWKDIWLIAMSVECKLENCASHHTSSPICRCTKSNRQPHLNGLCRRIQSLD